MKVFYFGADFCCQCKATLPRFESLMKAKGIDYEVLDVEKEAQLAVFYNVRSIPYVVVLNENDEAVDKGLAADVMARL